MSQCYSFLIFPSVEIKGKAPMSSPRITALPPLFPRENQYHEFGANLVHVAVLLSDIFVAKSNKKYFNFQKCLQ